MIPARYGSTRLPGKLLLDLAGWPMIRHVFERARSSGADDVVIATDDERIAVTARAFGAKVRLTSVEHRSGTERLAEVAEQDGDTDDRVYVNVQGDEPLIPPALIGQCAGELLGDSGADIATLATRINDVEELLDPAVVKVVRAQSGDALYFSRAPVPWDRDAFAADRHALPAHTVYWRHVGIYAYRVRYLRLHGLLGPSPLEVSECLEQLRALEHGYRIRVAEACEPPGPGVDTAQDLVLARAMLQTASMG